MNSRNQLDKWEKIARDVNLVNNAMLLAERDIRTANDVFRVHGN